MNCGPRAVVFSEALAMLRGQAVTQLTPSWQAKDPADDVACTADSSRLAPSGAALRMVDATISGDPALVVGLGQFTGNIVPLR